MQNTVKCIGNVILLQLLGTAGRSHSGNVTEVAPLKQKVPGLLLIATCCSHGCTSCSLGANQERALPQRT